MAIYIISGIIVTIGLIILLAVIYPTEDASGGMALLGLSLCTIGVAVIIFNLATSTPSAMDVYRGRTTLEITYRDGIPIDTTVVLKCK